MIEAVSKRGFEGDARETGVRSKQDHHGQWWSGGQRKRMFLASVLSSPQGTRYTRLSI